MVFESAQARCNFAKVKYVMYQARHGGPSHDRREKLRSLPEVRQRGRWLTEQSLRRYEAHARLQQEELKEPASTREAGRQGLKYLAKELRAALSRRRR